MACFVGETIPFFEYGESFQVMIHKQLHIFLGSRYDESPGCFEHEMSENNRSSIEMRSNYPKWCKFHTLIGKTHVPSCLPANFSGP